MLSANETFVTGLSDQDSQLWLLRCSCCKAGLLCVGLQQLLQHVHMHTFACQVTITMVGPILNDCKTMNSRSCYLCMQRDYEKHMTTALLWLCACLCMHADDAARFQHGTLFCLVDIPSAFQPWLAGYPKLPTLPASSSMLRSQTVKLRHRWSMQSKV